MNIKLNPIIVALLPLVIGLIVGWMVSPKKDVSYENELERQLQIEKSNAARYAREYDSLTLELKLALFSVESARDSLTIENQKSEYYRIRYEKSKTAPVNIADQHQLDSLLMARYPRYRYLKGR